MNTYIYTSIKSNRCSNKLLNAPRGCARIRTGICLLKQTRIRRARLASESWHNMNLERCRIAVTAEKYQKVGDTGVKTSWKVRQKVPDSAGKVRVNRGQSDRKSNRAGAERNIFRQIKVNPDRLKRIKANQSKSKRIKTNQSRWT